MPCSIDRVNLLTATLFSAAIFIFGLPAKSAETESSADSRDTLAVSPFRIVNGDETLTVFDGDSHVLTYQKAVLDPPPGADRVFRRSGFIHPLHTPGGALVTEIHPADHYHHFGLWHAWVHTQFDGKEVDFWNLRSKTGRIRFSKVIDTSVTADEASFCVEQEHVAFPDQENETVVLSERLTVTVAVQPPDQPLDEQKGAEGKKVYSIDYDVDQQNVTDKTVRFLVYRYGGMVALRGPLHWDRTNSRLVTSEGHDRNTGNGKPTRWAKFEGPASAESTNSENLISIVMLGHHENWDAPQRTRTWNDSIHRGGAFFMFSPTVNRELSLDASQSVRMRYRILLADEPLGHENIETAFSRFNEME